MIVLPFSGLVASVLLAAVSSSKVAWAVEAEESQVSIACAQGEEYDTIDNKCVAVSCDAPDACRKKEQCIARRKRCIEGIHPCPQFICSKSCVKGKEYDPAIEKCVPVTCEAHNACHKNQDCIRKRVACRKRPCKRFYCERKCPTGKKYHPVLEKCVKVWCDASNACHKNETCIPTRTQCPAGLPCAQYICKRNCPKGKEFDAAQNRCVPVSCDYPRACHRNKMCVPKTVLCTEGVCPQFFCAECSRQLRCNPCENGYVYDENKCQTCECLP